GPDFPTAGIIHGKTGIREAYETGRGLIKVRAKADIEEDKRGRSRIIVTEIPYQVNKTSLLEAIADLVRDKKVEGISDLRDESDRDGMRVVVELKADANAEIVLNQLFKHTQMETTFGIINLALVGGEPRVLPLRDLLQQFVDHRRQVIRRRTQFRLAKAEKRAHIVEGLRTAISKLDQTIALIRKSRSPEEARGALMAKMALSEEQANAILEMRLSRLTGLEREKLEQEYEELRKTIARLKKILASEKEILGLIREELQELKSKYGDERRTRIVERTVELGVEDLIAQEEMVVSITHGGYIKRLPVDSFRRQRRGGKGIVGMETKEEDFVRDIFVANTHDHLLFFSNLGKAYWLKTYEVPQAGRHAKGKAIINLIKVSPGERITASIPVHEFDDKRYLFFATRQGTVKKTRLDAFSNPRSSGIRAMGLRGGDELEDVKLTDGKHEVILATRLGQAVRFHEEEVRDMGRGAAGVRGIRVSRGDRVISLEVVEPKNVLLAITEKGYGKRTEVAEYRKTARGGKGVINVKVTDKTGPVVSILNVTDEDEIILMSSRGQTIRTVVKQISLQGRATQGVRVMNLEGGDRVVAAEKVIEEGNGNGEE
ncbi:MAG: DNA gyrase subunit A, partial [Euryarchaeota archaeon]|nr:DNA gyrase subunit A [Euryarchaeota archaeon]